MKTRAFVTCVSVQQGNYTILFIVTLIELSHFENSFETKYGTVKISHDYHDNLTKCKQKKIKIREIWYVLQFSYLYVYSIIVYQIWLISLHTGFLQNKRVEIWLKEKGRDLTQSIDTRSYMYITVNWHKQNDNTKMPPKTSITDLADRLSTSSWSSDSYQTEDVKLVYGIPIFPLTTKAVESTGHS